MNGGPKVMAALQERRDAEVGTSTDRNSPERPQAPLEASAAQRLNHGETMNRPPRYRPSSARDAAEAMFKPKSETAPPPATGAKPASSLPPAKEQVTLRIDRDVLEHFQAEGAGWQDRVNAALRKAAGL